VPDEPTPHTVYPFDRYVRKNGEHVDTGKGAEPCDCGQNGDHVRLDGTTYE
jgi:hypothetical protein